MHNIQIDQKKRNYAEKFDRSPFTAPTQLLPEKNTKGNYKRNSYTKQVTDETIPNLEQIFEDGLGFDSHLAEWFNIFFSLKLSKDTHPKAVTMDDMTAWINVKDMMDKYLHHYGGFLQLRDSIGY